MSNDAEIKKDFQEICKISENIHIYFKQNDKLIDALNKIQKEDLKRLKSYYGSKNGVIIDLRKDVINYLDKGNQLTETVLEDFINKHRKGKENQFIMYKAWFSLFFPLITFYGHEKMIQNLETFAKTFIADLSLSNKVSYKIVDFQGARQTGSDTLWVAVYNKEQPSQSTGVQFFISFKNGIITYGIYKHSNKSDLKKRVSVNANSFDYKTLFDYFKDETSRLEKDSPTAVAGNIVDNLQNRISDILTENLNIIFYGPPGTGKTYLLNKYYFDRFTTEKKKVSKEELLKDFIAVRTWWEMIAIVLKDKGKSKVPDIMNHELIKMKASISSSRYVQKTVWGELQKHTTESCQYVNVSKRAFPQIFKKNKDSNWELDINSVKDEAPILDELYEQYRNPKNEDRKRYAFVTFHQSFTYEDFIEGIKPNMDDTENELTYSIEDGIFKKMCQEAKADPDQNYAIFIDEINRGNISQILGELVTLIEDDKREGKDNELTVVLPYSKEKFSVPSNLYLIGTMNTADRSIEALDTALRRRFSFIEVPPDPDLIETEGKAEIDGINLVELLKTINQRIERLIDKDHMIGHSYFLNIENMKDLKNTFQNKIIPLLQEYFYGEYGKIGLILGKDFFEDSVDYNRDDFFAEFPDEDTSLFDDKKVYHIRNVAEMKDDEIKAAIKSLLRTKG